MNKTEAIRVLGLGPIFTANEARTTYRKLAHKHHPDKKGGSHEAMTNLNIAYELCKNGVSFGTQGQVTWGTDIGIIFETIFSYKKPKPKIHTVVQWFSQRMLNKLAKNRHKGFIWRSDNAGHLFDRLKDEVIELGTELLNEKMDKEAIINECANIANFAMFIADKAERQL